MNKQRQRVVKQWCQDTFTAGAMQTFGRVELYARFVRRFLVQHHRYPTQDDWPRHRRQQPRRRRSKGKVTVVGKP